MLFGHLAGLFVIDRQHIHAFDHRHQIVPSDIHPEVHGVHDNKSWAGWKLIQNRGLHRWHQVAQQQNRGIGVRGGNFGVKRGQCVEVGHQGIAGVHIKVVLAGPVERFFAHFDFEPFLIDAAVFHIGKEIGGKIFTYHGH